MPPRPAVAPLLAVLADGASATVTVQVTPAAAGTLTSTATVSTDVGFSNTARTVVRVS